MRWIGALIIVGLVLAIGGYGSARADAGRTTCYQVGKETRCDHGDGSRTTCVYVGKELVCRRS